MSGRTAHRLLLWHEAALAGNDFYAGQVYLRTFPERCLPQRWGMEQDFSFSRRKTDTGGTMRSGHERRSVMIRHQLFCQENAL